MTDDHETFKINTEDMERLREAAAHLSATLKEAWEGAIEALAEIYGWYGMTAQEVDEALYEAVQAAQEAEKAKRRRRTYQPPRRPQKAIPAVCKSMRICRSRPVARSHVQRRCDRKRG